MELTVFSSESRVHREGMWLCFASTGLFNIIANVRLCLFIADKRA